MLKSYPDASLCKGCRLCVDACPKQAVVPLETVNKKGYPITEVDREKCVGCGNCYRVCPDYVYEIREQAPGETRIVREEQAEPAAAPGLACQP